MPVFGDGHCTVVGCGGELSCGGHEGRCPLFPPFDALAAALAAAQVHALVLAEMRSSANTLIASHLRSTLAAPSCVGDPVGATPCLYLLTWHS